MTVVRAAALASVLVFGAAQPLAAQDLSHYRDYALGSTVASVVRTSGGREADARTLHVRPARIQTFEWRTPYVRATNSVNDPVRDVMFNFYDDQLYRVVVTYDRGRMEGLTNADVIEGLTAVYGTPAWPGGRGGRAGTPPVDPSSDTRTLARWEDTGSVLVLTRSISAPLFQLVLTSKALSGAAADAVTESLRLDAREAPQRELDQRNKDAAAATAANDKARATNKGTFRP